MTPKATRNTRGNQRNDPKSAPSHRAVGIAPGGRFGARPQIPDADGGVRGTGEEGAGGQAGSLLLDFGVHLWDCGVLGVGVTLGSIKSWDPAVIRGREPKEHGSMGSYKGRVEGDCRSMGSYSGWVGMDPKDHGTTGSYTG